MPSSRQLISSQVLGTAAASVTFSSIPATYKDLALKVSARTSGGWVSYPIYLTLNSTNSGSFTSLYGLAGSANIASVNSTASQLNAGGVSGNLATSNTFGSVEVYIPNYTGTTSKVYSGFGAGETSASFAPAGDSEQGMLNTYAGLVSVTSAITSLTIAGAGNFVTGSSFYLYGIKNS